MVRQLALLLCVAHAVSLGAQPVAPGPPQNLTGTVAGTTVTLRWQVPVTGAVPSSYLLQASAVPHGAVIASVPTTATTLTATNVPPGTYYVHVIAISGSGQSGASNEIAVTIVAGGGCTQPPNPPLGLTSSVAGGVVTLGWNTPAGGCTSTSYAVQVGSSAGASNVAHVDVGARTSLSAAAPAVPLYVRVVAINAFGTSAPSNEILVTGGPALKVPTNPNAPLWFSIEQGTGFIHFYGTRETGGAPGVPTMAELRTAASDPAVRIRYSAAGMPNLISSDEGFDVELARLTTNAFELRFTTDTGEVVSIPITLASARPVVTQMIADPRLAESDVGSRTAQLRLDTQGCAVPANADIRILLDGKWSPPAVRAGADLFEAELPQEGTTTIGVFCRAVRERSKMGVGLDELTEVAGNALLPFCGRIRIAKLALACVSMSLTLANTSRWAPVLEVICDETVAEGFDWFADLFRADYIRAEWRVTIDRVPTFMRPFQIHRVDPPPLQTLTVPCTRDAPRNLTASIVTSGNPTYGSGFCRNPPHCIRLTWERPLMELVNTYFLELGSRPGATDLWGGDYANWGGGLVGLGGMGNVGNTTTTVFVNSRGGVRQYIRMRARFHEPVTGRLFHLGSPSNEVVVDVPVR